MVSDSVILKKIERQPKHAAGFKQLVRELGVRGDERKQLLSRLERLVSGGQLLQVGGGRYAIPQASRWEEYGDWEVVHASGWIWVCYS